MQNLVIVLISAIVVCDAVTFPESFQRCKVLDNFESDQCFIKSIGSALLSLKDGNSDLKVPKLDPLRVDRLDIQQGNPSSPVNIKLSFLNFDMVGISSTVLQNITARFSNPKNWSLHIEGLIDSFQIIGDYEMNGKILILPIVGKGKCNVTFEKAKVFVNIFGESRIKNGTEYLKITNHNFNEIVQRIYFDFKNLFNGNELLGVTTNRFFEENWRIIYSEIGPYMDKGISQIVNSYIRKILEKVPYNDIFIVD